MQVPKSQTWPLGHTFPQPPQLLLSQFGSTQVLPPQQVSQVKQVTPAQLHVPPEQVEGRVHLTPQEPQLLLSLLVSTQPPPQQAAVLPVQYEDPH
jgi:hypothetical protein